jgi:trigger factor
MSKTKEYKNIEVKEMKETSEIEVTITIPKEAIEAVREEAISNLGKNVDIPGFRKGHVPNDILVKQLGEMNILEEAVNIIIPRVYPEIVTEKKIPAIGRPQLVLSKLAPGEDAEFKAITAILPELKLPEYAKIAKDELAKKSSETTEVSQDEVEEAVKIILRNKVHHDTVQASASPEEAQKINASELTIPELTDEYVATLGEFKDVSDFKTKLKENIIKEKGMKLRDKKRGAIIETLVEKTIGVVPALLIDSELEKMIGQLKDDVARGGFTFEQYLEQLQKSEVDLRKEWRESAEKKARLQIILNDIARVEKLTADKEQLEKEVVHIKEHHSEADEQNVRIYVEQILTNEEVFKFLEGQK